jgi:peptidoglycan/xylan/chitin deacetylase (PgdA/CDA1 family)
MLTGDGCAGGTCLNKDCKPLGNPEPIGDHPETGFDFQPSYIPNNVIIPTFDDVPDGFDDTQGNNKPGPWTTADLQWLNQNNIHADFFINSNNWCGPIVGDPNVDDSDCYNAIVEILTHHNPGNHTVHHVHLAYPNAADNPGCPDAATCDGELSDIEKLINKMSNGGRPHLTRFRAPYGEPYQTMDQARLAIAAPVVAKYAVEVDWNLDDGDSDCPDVATCDHTGDSIAAKVESLVGNGPGQGQWGILLMHGTFKWTHDALPKLYGPNGYFAQHGFKIGTVEDVICWKWGKHSWEIVEQLNNTPRSPN